MIFLFCTISCLVFHMACWCTVCWCVTGFDVSSPLCRRLSPGEILHRLWLQSRQRWRLRLGADQHPAETLLRPLGAVRSVRLHRSVLFYMHLSEHGWFWIRCSRAGCHDEWSDSCWCVSLMDFNGVWGFSFCRVVSLWFIVWAYDQGRCQRSSFDKRCRVIGWTDFCYGTLTDFNGKVKMPLICSAENPVREADLREKKQTLENKFINRRDLF